MEHPNTVRYQYAWIEPVSTQDDLDLSLELSLLGAFQLSHKMARQLDSEQSFQASFDLILEPFSGSI